VFLLHIAIFGMALASPSLATCLQSQIENVELLAEKCAAGKIDVGFLLACHSVIDEDAASHPSNSQLPPDFFAWLEGNSGLRDEARLAMAEVSAKVACNLQILRSFDESLVEKYPNLAIAFAATWSKGEDSIPRRYWVDEWLVQGRKVPKMAESFQFHIENSKTTRLNLRETPWQVLAHLTDSLTPIVERDWALQRYGKRKTSELRGMFGYVPYTLDPQRGGDEVYSLESFLEYGGPCTHNVQFAGGVFDAFGIPSGWAGGPGHTYPYWFEANRALISIHRTNEIGNRNGKIRNPLGSDHVWEDQLRLLVHELNDSVPKSRNATLAAWAYRRVKDEDRLAAAAILPAAIRENSYCYGAISALVDATAAGHLSPAKAGAAWKLVAKSLTSDSFQLSDFLDRVLPAIGAANPNDSDAATPYQPVTTGAGPDPFAHAYSFVSARLRHVYQLKTVATVTAAGHHSGDAPIRRRPQNSAARPLLPSTFAEDFVFADLVNPEHTCDHIAAIEMSRGYAHANQFGVFGCVVESSSALSTDQNRLGASAGFRTSCGSDFVVQKSMRLLDPPEQKQLIHRHAHD